MSAGMIMYDKWSLDVLYTGFDDEKFQSDFQKADEMIAAIQQFAKTLGSEDPKTTLTKAIRFTEDYQQVMSDLSGYCYLVQSADTSNTESASYRGLLMQKSGDIAKANTLIKKYIAGIENLEEVIGEDPFLNDYSFYLQEIQKADRYVLGEDVEEALSRMDVSGAAAWTNLQRNLTSSVKVDYKGCTTTLSAIRNVAYSSDASARKEAYEAEIEAYDKIKDAVAFSLNSIKMQDISECQLRGFASPLDKVLFRAKMQRSTLEALLEAMREYLPNFHSYLKAKAEALGHTNGLPWYDLFAPMGNSEKVYTVEEAKDYLVNIFEKCNPRMAEITNRAFEEEWIDFFPRDGKVGGAFCSNLKNAKQFRILTNYDGSVSDIVTLAHELGHGYHNFMIYDNRPLNTGYSMPVAETASTFNENLVTNYAIEHAASDTEKLLLIEGQLSDVTQIICDIYSRFLFESKVVENRSKKFMFADELCKIMTDSQKEAYGDGLDHNCLHPYMWICKSHYYNAGNGFYNFPYAFGGLFARGLYAKYKQEGQAFLEKYNQMLKETPVRSVEDAAKICDIDLTNKEFWLMSLHSYDETIAEFKRLVK